jgi:Secreted repeat of unknown function
MRRQRRLHETPAGADVHDRNDRPVSVVLDRNRAGVAAIAIHEVRERHDPIVTNPVLWVDAYNHHPLYMFAKDKKAGQTNGEGVDAFGGEWNVVSPAGAKIVKQSSSSGGGGYGP